MLRTFSLPGFQAATPPPPGHGGGKGVTQLKCSWGQMPGPQGFMHCEGGALRTFALQNGATAVAPRPPPQLTPRTEEQLLEALALGSFLRHLPWHRTRLPAFARRGRSLLAAVLSGEAGWRSLARFCLGLSCSERPPALAGKQGWQRIGSSSSTNSRLQGHHGNRGPAPSHPGPGTCQVSHAAPVCLRAVAMPSGSRGHCCRCQGQIGLAGAFSLPHSERHPRWTWMGSRRSLGCSPGSRGA